VVSTPSPILSGEWALRNHPTFIDDIPVRFVAVAAPPRGLDPLWFRMKGVGAADPVMVLGSIPVYVSPAVPEGTVVMYDRDGGLR
jgi:hypothetical protein